MSKVTKDKIKSTDLHSEVIKLHWKIDDFQTMINLVTPLKSMELKFDAGETIQLPTSWKFYFETRDIKEGKLGIYLCLLKSPTDNKEVYASFELVIKNSSGADFKRSSAAIKDYTEANSAWGYSDGFGSLSSLSTNVLSNGSLVMDVTFKLINFERANTSTTACIKKARFHEKSKIVVVEDFQKLFRQRPNPDFKIVMNDGKEFPVHRGILASRSPVFFSMFDLKMKEVANGEVRVEDLTSDAMEILLEYIYCGTVDDEWKEVAEELIYAAEKYSLTLLKEFLDTMLSEIVTSENVIDLLKVAKRFELETAEKELTEYAHQNFKEVLKSATSI